ncbi:MAG: hypothetical protein JXA09_04400 [Anaerolineae bacterium]|nr:hypothetical protein [Anaerolineae bacterium]
MNRRIVIAGASMLGVFLFSALLWVPKAVKPEPVPETPTPTVQPTATRPQAHEVRIVVRDAESGSPIDGAAVEVGDQAGTAGDDGSVVTTVPDGTSYRVSVRAPGYEPWEGIVETGVSADRMLSLGVDMIPNRVRGHVVGRGIVPLPAVLLTHQGEEVAVDDDGRFVLRRVLAGDTVRASHPGYAAREVQTDGMSAIYLVLDPIEVALEVSNSLTGAPVPEAVVCMDASCAETDLDGHVLFSGAEPGGVFRVERAGYAPAEVVFEGDGPLTAVLAPDALYGRIRDAETGEVITRTVVLVGDQIAPLDEDGVYHATGLLEAGSLFVKAPGYRRVEIPIGPETRVDQVDALSVCEGVDLGPCVDVHLERFAMHGIYVSYNILVWDTPRLLGLIDLVDRSPVLNGIVVDIKGDFGYLAFESDHPLLVEVGAMTTPRMSVEEFLRICKEKDIYTVARMVVFKDTPLVEARPELAVRHPNGEIFYDREGMAWADPMREEVWEYEIAVTEEAIRMGFDEVQYDYLRFPSDSTSLEVVRALVYKQESTIESRTAAIRGFMQAAKAVVDRTHAFLSADLFGYALVIQPDHDMRIGQRLKDLAPHADYVCPMIYPSTFESGNLGLASPADEPYRVIELSMALAAERTDTPVRPWLQHYWYEREQLAAQRRAAEAASKMGWCFWNARGEYDEAFFMSENGDVR